MADGDPTICDILISYRRELIAGGFGLAAAEAIATDAATALHRGEYDATEHLVSTAHRLGSLSRSK